MNGFDIVMVIAILLFARLGVRLASKYIQLQKEEKEKSKAKSKETEKPKGDG